MSEGEKPVVQAQEQKQDSAQTPVDDLAQLQGDLAATKEQLIKAQAEAKAHQSNFTKAQQRARELENLHNKIQGIEDDIGSIAKYIGSQNSKSKEVEDYDQPKPPGQSFSLEEERKKRVQQRYTEIAQKADSMAKQAGMDMENSPELLKALNLFLRGKPDEGMAEVERVVGEKKPASTNTQVEPQKKELTPEEEEEIARKVLERKGALKSDTGSPSGAMRSWNDWLEAYGKGDVSTTEMKAEASRRGKTLA